MKKSILFLLSLSMLVSAFCISAYAEEEIKVYVNEKLVECDTPPVIVQDRTMVPLRAIAEALGCEAEWDDNAKMAGIFADTINLFVQLDNNEMVKRSLQYDGTVRNEKITIDAPPVIINSRTLVPVRAVSEGLDASVTWDEATRSVFVVKENSVIAPVVEEETNKSDPIHIKITLTDEREIEADLYPHIAPQTVENFVNLINEKFFDGLIFHRVINGFMIQGGGFDETFYDGNFTTKDCGEIEGEFKSNGFENSLKHKKGVLSMARTNDPNSASSQFFIMHETSPHLDGEYAAFGEVTKGIAVVDEIAKTNTTVVEGYINYLGNKIPQQMEDVPEKPVVIKTITIESNI